MTRYKGLSRRVLEKSSTLTLATELLQAAEQKLRDSGAILDNEPVLPASIPSIPPRLIPPGSPLGELDRCPVLPVSIGEDSRLVALGKEGSLGAEKFRFLAVRLRQLRQSRPLKKVLITSTIPEEGKSTVAANLACTLARRKPQKTLLLEGDLRRPNIAAQFGLSKLPGLCEWLSGGDSKHQHLPSGKSWGLDVTCGLSTAKPIGIDAIRKAFAADGTARSLVRLDRYRFSTGAPSRGYESLVPPGRWNSAGHAKRHHGKTAIAART